MKRILISIFLAFSLVGFAQVKNINVDDFPKVSFVWHEYSPNQRAQSDFVLEEENNAVAFDFKCSQVKNERNKTLLFLWEDMPANMAQYHFCKEVLQHFFNQTAIGGDKFNVAVFNRLRNSEELLQFLSDDFVADKQVLLDKINNYRHSNAYINGQPYSSDLFAAIADGLNALHAQTDNKLKAIIVLTAGKNAEAAGVQDEFGEIVKNAKRQEIPVYVIQYIIKGKSPKIHELAKSAFGETVSTVLTNETQNSLAQWYSTMNTRLAGFDYQFTFNTPNAKHDGLLRIARLQIANRRAEEVKYQAKSFSLDWWIGENILLFIVLFILFMAIIVILYIFIKKQIEKERAEAEQQKAEQKQINDRQETQIRAAEAENRRIQSEIEAKKREEERLKEEERQNALLQQMRVQNLYPRLVGNVNGENINFTVTKLETTIGKSPDNDLSLEPNNVSRYHAKIVFNGNDFEIFDLDSTNGTVVNGFPIQHATLKNTDILGFGEAILTIYI